MEKTFMTTTWVTNMGLLLARIAVGVIFIYQGWSKLSDPDSFSQALTGWGFPAELFFAYLIGITELLGGISVLLGIFARIGALALFIVMVGALLIVQIPGGEFNAMFQNTLALFGTTAALIGVGAGKWRLWVKEHSWN